MISPGLFAFAPEPEPVYLPPLWSVHDHPEGSVYFVRNTCPRVVTDAYLYEPRIQDSILKWIDVIDKAMVKLEIVLSESVELYLKPAEDEDTCYYYFIDHETRVEFWLESVEVGLLDLGAAVSDGHLRHALEEQYWNHVEQFPSHSPHGLDIRMPILVDIMMQGRADHLMSTTSTFPYSATECSNFIRLMTTAQDLDRCHSAQTCWSVARLWSMICHHRFNIHSGQEHCRLSRDQSILAQPARSNNMVYTATNWLLCSIPSLYESLLEDLWVDQLAYINQWRPFIQSCKEEWILAIAMLFSIILCNLMLLVGSIGSQKLAYASVFICNVGIVCAVRLLIQHQRSAFDTSQEAASFLFDSHSEKHGFKLTAILFSLPRALLLWALSVSSCQSIAWLLCVLPRGYAAVIGLALAVFGLGYCVITHFRKR